MRTQNKILFMKSALLNLALLFACSALATTANAGSPKSTPSPTPAGTAGEFQYARDMAHRVHDEIALYGSNQRIRSQIKKVDVEILQVNKEISTHNYDRNQVHAEVVRIDDELHTIDLELRDLSIHEPMSLTGGKNSLPR
jgi:hypothetical protein